MRFEWKQFIFIKFSDEIEKIYSQKIRFASQKGLKWSKIYENVNEFRKNPIFLWRKKKCDSKVNWIKFL
jgi:hypothetical protein